jgi:Zn-dependent protease with chaperone function
MESGLVEDAAAPEEAALGAYFDGVSNRRRRVKLVFGADRLELQEAETPAVVTWLYADIRRVDASPGVLRLACLSALPLARLEIRDAVLAQGLIARSHRLDEGAPGSQGVGSIVGWSLAAAASIVLVILFGLPLAADRLAPLVPQPLERRLGEVAEQQIRVLFSGQSCSDRQGQSALDKLVGAMADAAGLDMPIRTAALSTPVANAFALPGGTVYLLNGLLAKAENPDEIAGVLAHELGHLKHRDSMRNLIYHGGMSFLIGLLFGDVTGSGALIVASRTLVSASYTREAEEGADGFAIEVMHKLGRSPKPMGELLLRVTGKQSGTVPSILASHPLTEDRLKRMSEEDRPPGGPPLLTSDEWAALKAICK